MSAREQQARAEIARRRALAEKATPGPWSVVVDHHRFDRPEVSVWSGAEHSYVTEDVSEAWMPNAEHIAANDPAHVLAVLTAAEATLDRHASRLCGVAEAGLWRSECIAAWPCADARAVLDLYAPEATL